MNEIVSKDGESMGNYLEKYRLFPIQVKASLWFLVCSFLQKGISSITTPIFTRLLTTAEYGQYNIFNSWLGIVTIFVSLNLSAGVYTQGLIKFDQERNVFSASLQGLTLTLTAIWTLIYALFHSFWNNLLSLTTVQMLAMLVMIWTSSVFNFWASEQRVILSYKKLVIVTLLVSFAKPVVGIFFVLHSEDKVTARILGLVIVEFVGYIGLFIAQMRRGKKSYSGKFWKYAIFYNLPLIPHYLSQTVLSSADRIMIGSMVGENEAGIYSLAYSVSLIMTLFNTALSQTISPWIYQKIKDKRTKDIADVAYVSLILIAAVNLMLIALAPEVVALFAPKSYYDAIWVIPPVAMSVYFMFAYDLFAKFQFYYEKTKFVMIASVIAAILNILLNYIFIGIFGYYAAGYTTLFCYIASTVGHYLFMQQVCKKYMSGEKVYSTRVLLALTTIFMSVGFLFLLTYKFSLIRYLIIAGLCIIAIIYRKKIIEITYRIFETRKK